MYPALLKPGAVIPCGTATQKQPLHITDVHVLRRAHGFCLACKLTAVRMTWHIYRNSEGISRPAVSTLQESVQAENVKLSPAPSSALWLVYRAEIKH